MEDVYKEPKISHEEFVRKYRAREISVLVHKTNSLRAISLEYLPKMYYWAHTFWSWIWLLSIPAGIVMLFIKPWVGILILFFISFLGQRVIKETATQFVLEHALENEIFYKDCIEGKLIIITNEK